MTRLNRNLFWANLTWAAAACLAAPMSAVDVQLAAVQFPDNKTVDLPLAATTAWPPPSPKRRCGIATVRPTSRSTTRSSRRRFSSPAT